LESAQVNHALPLISTVAAARRDEATAAKLGAPEQPKLAMGAATAAGWRYIDREIDARRGVAALPAGARSPPDDLPAVQPGADRSATRPSRAATTESGIS
jgi:hypothetical protein